MGGLRKKKTGIYLKKNLRILGKRGSPKVKKQEDCSPALFNVKEESPVGLENG